MQAPWRILFLRLSLLFLAALTACGGDARPDYAIEQQQADGVTITLEHPRQLQTLQDYELFVVLADAGGKPIDGATVFIDMAMPSMSMGANQPLADPLGNGRYRIKGVFTMAGAWRLTVHAKIAGTEHTAIFKQIEAENP